MDTKRPDNSIGDRLNVLSVDIRPSVVKNIKKGFLVLLEETYYIVTRVNKDNFTLRLCDEGFFMGERNGINRIVDYGTICRNVCRVIVKTETDMLSLSHGSILTYLYEYLKCERVDLSQFDFRIKHSHVRAKYGDEVVVIDKFIENRLKRNNQPLTSVITNINGDDIFIKGYDKPIRRYQVKMVGREDKFRIAIIMRNDEV